MDCCPGFAQCTLLIINAVFALFGLVFLVVGCMVRFGSPLLDGLLQNFYAALQELMDKAAGGSSPSNFSIGEYLQGATLAFILIGTFIFLLGIFGCVGACCQVECCLIIYAVVVAIFFLGEVVMVVVIFAIQEKVEASLKAPLYDSLRNEYVGINSSDVISVGWNFAMISFKCCGVENYTDFDKASKWRREWNNGTHSYNLTVPVACCKLKGTFPRVQVPDNSTCALYPNENTANIKQGCFQAFKNFLKDNISILIGVGVAIVVTEVLMFIFAVCVYLAARQEKEEDMDPWG